MPIPVLTAISLSGFRGYASLDATFGPGAHLVWGPNAAGKTSLLEALVVCARGSSHRTLTDAELIRWDAPFARVDTRREVPGLDPLELEVTLVREGPAGGRKRIRVNGVPRRATALAGLLRVVVFAPEDMLLIAGSPSLRRGVLDALTSQRIPAHAADVAAYGRVLAQRNALLRAIRDERATPDQLPPWNAKLVESGAAIVDARHRVLGELAGPLVAAHAEIASDEGRFTITYESNVVPAAGEPSRDALVRRLAETAEKEAWNGSTLVGPHRDDLAFRLDGRDLATFASRGQQRTAILALKLGELDLLTTQDGRPPLVLLDDVFSELDPVRRGHLVRRIAGLPQAFITTTTLDDLDPALREIGVAWEVVPDAARGARLIESRAG
jgi:DNA replication and repair protein RecF